MTTSYIQVSVVRSLIETMIFKDTCALPRYLSLPGSSTKGPSAGNEASQADASNDNSKIEIALC